VCVLVASPFSIVVLFLLFFSSRAALLFSSSNKANKGLEKYIYASADICSIFDVYLRWGRRLILTLAVAEMWDWAQPLLASPYPQDKYLLIRVCIN